MSLDHEAIFKAYPDCVSSDDSVGAFKADGTKITINQSLVDAARVELNKLNYQTDRTTNGSTTYAPTGAFGSGKEIFKLSKLLLALFI